MRLSGINHRIITSVITIALMSGMGHAQDFAKEYADFKKKAETEYGDFRKECNRKYIEFLKKSWEKFEQKPSIPHPKDDRVAPRPYVKDDPIDTEPEVNPIEIDPIKETPQPKPIEPIREAPTPDEHRINIGFYGIEGRVRLPDIAKTALKDCSPESIADAWGTLSDNGLNNAIRDCLETRIRHNLCDWAYLMYLDRVGKQYCDDPNGATLLTAFLFCQSGYQMRFATEGHRLILLYGTRHQQYNKNYYSINGLNFYALGTDLSNSIRICNAAFEGETPMVLAIDKEQLLGSELTDPRTVKSTRFKDLTIESKVPENLIRFYNEFPSSQLDGNPLTRWAIYANAPLAQKTKDAIYPVFKREIDGLTQLQSVEKILNLIQTGFTYGYDTDVWGQDRAFFAEETLFYPYSDCEDRAILFSRLVRDLVGLDVALVYYPNHLATAVCFNDPVNGDAMRIGGRNFTICDPTYIGAPVGKQMPGLEHDKTQAILLR